MMGWLYNHPRLGSYQVHTRHPRSEEDQPHQLGGQLLSFRNQHDFKPTSLGQQGRVLHWECHQASRSPASRAQDRTNHIPMSDILWDFHRMIFIIIGCYYGLRSVWNGQYDAVLSVSSVAEVCLPQSLSQRLRRLCQRCASPEIYRAPSVGPPLHFIGISG